MRPYVIHILAVPSGAPKGIRTPVSTLKGWRPRPLDDGGRRPVEHSSHHRLGHREVPWLVNSFVYMHLYEEWASYPLLNI